MRNLIDSIAGPASITIPRWFDRHLHLRDGEMLATVLPCTLASRATGAVIIGNLGAPDETSTIEKTIAYRQRIMAQVPPQSDFVTRMTCFLTDDITPQEVVRGFDMGVWCAVKLMMTNQHGQGGSTGSQNGVKNLLGRYPVFEAMEKRQIPLLGHFESVDADVDEYDREIVSVDRHVKPLLRQFPELPVVVEHVTDGRTGDFIAQALEYNIQGTVTAHHLTDSRNALFTGGLNPGNYCKPVFKEESHRLHLRKIIPGNPRFGACTDSAPHVEAVKSLCYGNKAGIFTAPIAVELFTTVFDEEDSLEDLDMFLSRNFLHLYGMEVSRQMMTIARVPREVPQKVGPVQVYRGGTTLPWKLIG